MAILPIFNTAATYALSRFGTKGATKKALDAATPQRSYLTPSADKQYGPSVPEGFDYSKVSTPQTASTVNTAISSTPTGRKLGPSEYANLRQQYGVGESNFGQYFERDNSGNIYLKNKGTQPPTYSASPITTPSTAPTSTAPTTATTTPTRTSSNLLSDPSFLKKTAENKLTELQKNYLSTLTPSAEETAAQQQLTDFLGSTELGISGLEGQGRGIPLSLVRGQQAKLQEQANIKAQTLQNQIANYQAARAAAGDVYSAELDFEKQRLEREVQAQQQEQALQTSMLSAGYTPVDPASVTDANSVVQIGGQTFLKPSPESKIYEIGDSLIEYSPGGVAKIVYSAPSSGGDGFTLSAGQTRYSADGTPIAHASETIDSGYDSTTGTYTVKPEDAQKINQQIASSDAYKALNTASTLESSIENLETLIAGLEGSGNRFFGKEAGQLSTAYNTLMLQAKEFFNLGVLNGPDLEILKSIVPSPNEISLKGGTTAGLEQMRKMINDTVKARYNDLVTQYSGYDLNQITNLQNVERKYRENVYGNLLRIGEDNGGISQQEYDDLIEEMNQSFTRDPGMSQKGLESLSSFKTAIATQESGQRYNAIGPATSKGNRAYGKYQVMDFNIPSWTKAALGRSLTTQEFLNSPEAQEAVADYKFNEYFKKYGNWEDVASVWFSGRPVSQAGNSSDVTGTTVPNYVRNIISMMS